MRLIGLRLDVENFAALFLKDEPLPITLPEVKTEPKVEGTVVS